VSDLTPAQIAARRAVMMAGGTTSVMIADALEVAAKKQQAREERALNDGLRAIANWRAGRRCVVCKNPMAATGRDRHYACDPTAIEGTRCICRKGCSDVLIGSGSERCDPDCVPCRLRQGQPLKR
jgi:hypothetical protein